MGRKTNILILVPLSIFASIIFGFGIFNTVCKNANIPIGC